MKLQDGEKILHELHPEKIILLVWFFTKCLPLAAVTVAITSLPFFIFPASSNFERIDIVNILVYARVTFPLFTLLALIYYRFLRKSYIFYITNQRCVFHGGIIRRVERSVPYHKITDVEKTQNIIEQILGISKLNIFTPGTASLYQAEISYFALRDNETAAETINEILRKFKSTGE